MAEEEQQAKIEVEDVDDVENPSGVVLGAMEVENGKWTHRSKTQLSLSTYTCDRMTLHVVPQENKHHFICERSVNR